ncbi:hypothetical protein BSL78_08977 [Apostichopus japonicus]|uniref:Uncharacterized protein n=1 Tax=Stichopus japonicus TaxID=307972 RepID=A0A2G8L1K8_STIJA|nr:hypothetical protein BSL78_08977 [Apostichopus japonicus]
MSNRHIAPEGYTDRIYPAAVDTQRCRHLGHRRGLGGEPSLELTVRTNREVQLRGRFKATSSWTEGKLSGYEDSYIDCEELRHCSQFAKRVLPLPPRRPRSHRLGLRERWSLRMFPLVSTVREMLSRGPRLLIPTAARCVSYRHTGSLSVVLCTSWSGTPPEGDAATY